MNPAQLALKLRRNLVTDPLGQRADSAIEAAKLGLARISMTLQRQQNSVPSKSDVSGFLKISSLTAVSPSKGSLAGIGGVSCAGSAQKKVNSPTSDIGNSIHGFRQLYIELGDPAGVMGRERHLDRFIDV